MNRNTFAIIGVCLLLLILMDRLAGKLYPPIPVPVATNQPAGSSNAALSGIGTNSSGTNALSTGTGLNYVVHRNIPEELLVVTNDSARYTFTSRGGGLQAVELFHYPEIIAGKKQPPTGPFVALNSAAAPPVLSILGDNSLQDDGVFKLTQTTNGVRAEKTLSNGLVVIKDFRLGSNYLVTATVRLQNPNPQPLALPAQEWFIGTATPLDKEDKEMYVGTMWFDGAKQQECPVSYFSTNTGLFHRTIQTEYHSGTSNVTWAAAHNQYFALLAMPAEPAPHMIARAMDLPAFPEFKQLTNAPPPPRGVLTAFVYPAQSLASGASVERQIVIFAGPKEYRLLARIGEEFHNQADLVMNFGTGFAGFWGIGSFFAKLLLAALNGLHSITGLGYGWGIVLITLILRAVFWPLTAAALRSSKKMQALNPEMKALREKYKDDPQKQQAKTWELYKKHGVSPFSSCLPSLIQMPVFFGFLAMIRSAIELRGASFLWVSDLSKPDTLGVIPGLTFVPFLSTPQGLPFNLLPLLMVAVMVWQAHLQPPSPGMDPSQQKMMRYMPLIFLVFLYNYSSGMALYMTISTLSSAIQAKMARLQPTPSLVPAPVLTAPQKKKK